MISKDIIAEALVAEYTPMELAMKIIEAEENRVRENMHKDMLCNENVLLREWCDFLKNIVKER